MICMENEIQSARPPPSPRESQGEELTKWHRRTYTYRLHAFHRQQTSRDSNQVERADSLFLARSNRASTLHSRPNADDHGDMSSQAKAIQRRDRERQRASTCWRCEINTPTKTNSPASTLEHPWTAALEPANTHEVTELNTWVRFALVIDPTVRRARAEGAHRKDLDQ
jgi:hypothetical protein